VSYCPTRLAQMTLLIEIDAAREESVTEGLDMNEYVRQVRELADAKGFGSGPERIWEMLALIHSEISEATDAYKKGKTMEDVGEELIDALIRIFHLLSALDQDAEALYRHKMEKNWARPYKYNTVRGGD
jgi:NTP pyrophosphatase (non-canonical NTP hydrolase)